MKHDKDATQKITQCSTKDCYQLGLNYKNSMEQVKAIIGVSETCQQKIEVKILFILCIKWNCTNCSLTFDIYSSVAYYQGYQM